MAFRAVLAALGLACVCVVAACGSATPERAADGRVANDAAERAPADRARAERPPARARSADDPRIIILGDSLTAGLGLDVEKSFPARLQEHLDQSGYRYQVVNAGVSGDTSAGGLRRLEWALAEGRPQILIIALGGNDGLRGLPPTALEKNLSAIIERARAQKLTVLLTGMEAPPNFGADYTSEFRQTYTRVAAKYQIELMPFLLQDVAGSQALNQADGIHPNERGAQRVADNVWRQLEPLLTKTDAAPRVPAR